jgi:predicted NBD/HSP70 family sugar kinase
MNLARVWAALRDAREVTRPHLAERTDLSRTTVAALVDDLLAAGILRAAGQVRSRGGRPAELLRFDPTACLAVGADMAAPDVRLVLVDLDGRIVARAVRRMVALTPDALVAALADGVQELTGVPLPRRVGETATGGATGAARPPILGLGLGATGVVEPEAGVLRLSVPLGWRDVPLAALLSRRVAMPVRVLSEDQAAALAEHAFGAACDVRRLVYVGVGTGIGAGIVLDGQVYGGADGGAGEVGHVTIVPDGPKCLCGNRGCLEALAAGPAIAAAATRRMAAGEPSALAPLVRNSLTPLTAGQVATAAIAGDLLAAEVLTDAGRWIGIAVAGLINLLNPDAVIIGGDAVIDGSPLLTALREEAQRRALSGPCAHARLLPVSLGSDTTAVGAACLILREAPQLVARLATGNYRRTGVAVGA